MNRKTVANELVKIANLLKIADEPSKKMTKEQRASLMVKQSKEYNSYSVGHGVVEKSFNSGMGSLSLYRFDDNGGVTVNGIFESKSDRAKLLKLFPDIKITEDELGYPDYYKRGLKAPSQ